MSWHLDPLIYRVVLYNWLVVVRSWSSQWSRSPYDVAIITKLILRSVMLFVFFTFYYVLIWLAKNFICVFRGLSVQMCTQIWRFLSLIFFFLCLDLFMKLILLNIHGKSMIYPSSGRILVLQCQNLFFLYLLILVFVSKEMWFDILLQVWKAPGRCLHVYFYFEDLRHDSCPGLGLDT